jgi:NAD-dependent dihydropyrimidine dehydrogenase PreA subunit
MAIEKIDQDLCIGCGQCVQACYADIIRMDEDMKKAVAKYPEDCAVCCWCVALCPVNAVVVTPVKTSPVFTSWG